MTYTVKMPTGKQFGFPTKEAADQHILDMGGELIPNAPEVGEKAAAIAAMAKAIEVAKKQQADKESPVTSAEFWGNETQMSVVSTGKTTIRQSKAKEPYTTLTLQATGVDGVTVKLRGLLPTQKKAEDLISGANLTIEKGDPTTSGRGYLFNIL